MKRVCMFMLMHAGMVTSIHANVNPEKKTPRKKPTSQYELNCSLISGLPYSCVTYLYVFKKDQTFAMKTLLLILQHFKHCPLQSSLNRAQWCITYVSLDGAIHLQVYKACSKKDRTFAIKTLLLI
jgi:hypothetical protein